MDLSALLTEVNCTVTAVVDAPAEKCWEAVCKWPHHDWLPALNQAPVRVAALEGGGQVGGRRRVDFGSHHQYFEQLVGRDDVNHTLRWKLVSHPGTVHPFGEAVFLDFSNCVHFETITMGNKAFAKWSGCFWTERCHSEILKMTLENWFYDCLQGLEDKLKPAEPVSTPRSILNGTPFTVPPSSMASWDSISAGSNSSLFPASSAALRDHAGLGMSTQAHQPPASQLGVLQPGVPSAADSVGIRAQAEKIPMTTAVMNSLTEQIIGLESKLQQLSGPAAAGQELQLEQAMETAVRGTLLSIQAIRRGDPCLAAAQPQLNAAQLAGAQQLAAGILQQPVAAQSTAAGQQIHPDAGLAWMPHIQQASATGLSPAAALRQQLPHSSMGVESRSGTLGGEIPGSLPQSPRTAAGLGLGPHAHAPRSTQLPQPASASPDSPRIEASSPRRHSLDSLAQKAAMQAAHANSMQRRSFDHRRSAQSSYKQTEIGLPHTDKKRPVDSGDSGQLKGQSQGLIDVQGASEAEPRVLRRGDVAINTPELDLNSFSPFAAAVSGEFETSDRLPSAMEPFGSSLPS